MEGGVWVTTGTGGHEQQKPVRKSKYMLLFKQSEDRCYRMLLLTQDQIISV